MCFLKTKESKVLVAKRDIRVYKIGTYANNTSFKPYYYSKFKYYANQITSETVKFTNTIEHGLHSYINCILCNHRFSNCVDLYTSKGCRCSVYLLRESLFLGKFIIPKGGTYCMNIYNEVVSDKLMYTGIYTEIFLGERYNTRKLWKEK